MSISVLPSKHLGKFQPVFPFALGLDELLRVMGELLVIKRR